jgi:hypothetical protein
MNAMDDSLDNSLDAILSPSDMEHWKKLGDNHRLVQLQRKFWHQNLHHKELLNVNQDQGW